MEHLQRVLQHLLHQNKMPSNKRNSQRQKENNSLQIQTNLLLSTQLSSYKMLRETCWKPSLCWIKRPSLEGEWRDTERQGRAGWCWCWSGWMDPTSTCISIFDCFKDVASISLIRYYIFTIHLDDRSSKVDVRIFATSVSRIQCKILFNPDGSQVSIPHSQLLHILSVHSCNPDLK